MYTVLLVDDEPLILESLTTTISWEQFGVSTLLTAPDGSRALELLEKNSVDLLITDIKMPHMDGLALLHKVRESYPDIHCILLTAYGEFEYARTAIHLGVENYLLKPFNKEELERTIETALENIYTQKKISHHLFVNNILLRWANGAITGEELSERGNLLDLNLYLPEYCAVCIQKREKISISSFCNQCSKEFSDYHYEVYLFKDNAKRHAFIIGSEHIQPKQLLDTFEELAKRFQLDHQILISIGNTVQNADAVPESYQTALNLLESFDPENTASIVYAQNLSYEQDIDRFIQECNLAFRQPENDNLDNTLLHLAERSLTITERNPACSLKPFLLSSLCRLFSREFPNHPVCQEQIKNRFHLFSAPDNQEALLFAVADLLKYALVLFQYYLEQSSPIIRSAIRYIQEHYAEGISIQEFCTRNKINPAYMGYLFKKETGFFFNNYLTQYRICSSIPLLLDTDLKINDIAQRSGFAYPSYYISCFRRQTGQSPTKYRMRQN